MCYFLLDFRLKDASILVVLLILSTLIETSHAQQRVSEDSMMRLMIMIMIMIYLGQASEYDQ